MNGVFNNVLNLASSTVGTKTIVLRMNIDEYVVCYHLVIDGRLEFAHTVYRIVAKRYEACIRDALEASEKAKKKGHYDLKKFGAEAN